MEANLTERSAAVTIALSAITLVAFASNSVLCRMALAGGAIDPAGFTILRILSGAATLWVVSAFLRRSSRPSGSWISAAMLALYAFAFSYAYVSLSIATPQIGSELWDIMKDMKIEFPEEVWSDYYMQSNTAVLNKHITKDVVDRFLLLNERDDVQREIKEK